MTSPRFLLMGLLALWQALYLIVIFRRDMRFGLAAAGYTIAWYGLLVWAGAPWTMAIAILTALEAVSVGIVVRYAPKTQRVIALAFTAVAGLLIIVSLIEPIVKHWRVAVGLLTVCVLTASGLAYFLSGFGRFGVGSLRRRIVAQSFDNPRNALLKYTYWSQRAIDSLLSDNQDARTRFAMKLAELSISIPVAGAKVTFERVTRESGRHAAAQELWRWLGKHISTDEEQIFRQGGGFLTRTGEVYVTAYGSESVDNAPTGGRAALFTNWTTDGGQRVAMCLFGSMDNFDGWIRDSHPAAVTGWANSATPHVMDWLQQNREWDTRFWGESVGNVACKMSNYQLAMGSPDEVGSNDNYAKQLIMKEDSAEWLGFIYYAEKRDEGLAAPFDIVLVGRPIWLRSEHFWVKTADEHSASDISGSEQFRWASFWRKALRLQEDAKGWPVYLYRFLLARKGIESEL